MWNCQIKTNACAKFFCVLVRSCTLSFDTAPPALVFVFSQHKFSSLWPQDPCTNPTFPSIDWILLFGTQPMIVILPSSSLLCSMAFTTSFNCLMACKITSTHSFRVYGGMYSSQTNISLWVHTLCSWIPRKNDIYSFFHVSRFFSRGHTRRIFYKRVFQGANGFTEKLLFILCSFFHSWYWMQKLSNRELFRLLIYVNYDFFDFFSN